MIMKIRGRKLRVFMRVANNRNINIPGSATFIFAIIYNSTINIIVPADYQLFVFREWFFSLAIILKFNIINSNNHANLKRMKLNLARLLLR